MVSYPWVVIAAVGTALAIATVWAIRVLRLSYNTTPLLHHVPARRRNGALTVVGVDCVFVLVVAVFTCDSVVSWENASAVYRAGFIIGSVLFMLISFALWLRCYSMTAMHRAIVDKQAVGSRAAVRMVMLYERQMPPGAKLRLEPAPGSSTRCRIIMGERQTNPPEILLVSTTTVATVQAAIKAALTTAYPAEDQRLVITKREGGSTEAAYAPIV